MPGDTSKSLDQLLSQRRTLLEDADQALDYYAESCVRSRDSHATTAEYLVELIDARIALKAVRLCMLGDGEPRPEITATQLERIRTWRDAYAAALVKAPEDATAAASIGFAERAARQGLVMFDRIFGLAEGTELER